MTIEIRDELIIEGVAAATERALSSPAFIDRIAEAVINRFEALTPHEAAKFLDVTTRTLADNHVAWGLDKSVALGQTNPRYFLSQIVAAMKGKAVRGSAQANAEKPKPEMLRRAA